MVEDKIPIPTLKRIFDILFALIGLIISSPVWVIIAAAIFFEHILAGNFFAPIFYREKRISFGEPFDLIKFNIFKPGVIKQLQASQKFITTKEIEKNKEKLTRVGWIVKNLYLDELPQLVNVLRGEMSVVGPRPVNLKVYHRLLARGINNKKIIKAGLTGNFQSLKGLTKKTDVELDGEYVDFCRSHSVWRVFLFDFKIILRTIRVMIQAKGI